MFKTPELALEEQTFLTEEEIDYRMRKLALESQFLENNIETFRELLPSLSEKLKQSLSHLTSGSMATAFSFSNFFSSSDTVEFNGIRVKLNEINYNNYRKILISVPEGFNGKFCDFVEEIAVLSPTLIAETELLLARYNTLLSIFITNKNDRQTLKDHTSLYKESETLRNKVTKRLDVFFTDKDLSKAYLESAISRTEDLRTLSKQYASLDKLNNKKRLVGISESVKKSVELLDLIIKNTTTADIDKVSGASTANLAKGAMELAKLVEWVSVMAFRTEQITKSITDLFNKFKNLQEQ